MRCHLALVVLTGWSFTCSAGEPKPTAAELVQGIIDAENKVQEVRSLYLRYEGKWTRTPEAIAAAREELKKQSPKAEIDESKHSNLWPEMTEELELAFDEKRVRSFAHWHKASRDLRVFDGVKAVARYEYFPYGQDSYSLRTEAQDLFKYYFLSLSWLRAGTPSFWFIKDEIGLQGRKRVHGLPEDFSITGEEAIRGRQCYVLENPTAHRRLHVGSDDRRLHQMTIFVTPNGTDTSAAEDRAAGRTFASKKERMQWLKTLSTDEAYANYLRFQREIFPQSRPMSIHFSEDYREIAPGLWTPGLQGYSSIDPYDGSTRMSRELRLVEAKVNEPLADNPFEIELKEGVQVGDMTHDPPLFYKHKADRTPEEWQAIVDDHKQRSDAWQKQKALRDALIGKPAPELPTVAWLNGPQVDWAALKGKVVLLDFWATTCGPCRNDLPHVEELHQNSSQSGIITIGLHTAGTDPDEVAKFAKEMKLTYPIAIDQPTKGKSSFGQFCKLVEVNAIPYTFVIDRDGNIAAHGRLQEVLPKARTLASQPAK